jgi:hypothetical protein
MAALRFARSPAGACRAVDPTATGRGPACDPGPGVSILTKDLGFWSLRVRIALIYARISLRGCSKGKDFARRHPLVVRDSIIVTITIITIIIIIIIIIIFIIIFIILW